MASTTATGSPEFSLVLGGPLYQLWRRARLTGDALQLLRRRDHRADGAGLGAAAGALGRARARLGRSVRCRFSTTSSCTPASCWRCRCLILAELVVHRRMRPSVGQFLERGLIPDSELAAFDAAVASAMRLRNSVWVEALLIALVYVVGVGFLWRTQMALPVASWHGAHGRREYGGRRSPAGGWAW